MTEPLPSPKSRLRPVYTVPEDTSRRTERVVYQLEDTGHPVLRLRPTVRLVEEDGDVSYLYRVEALSRLRRGKLGQAELVASVGSPAQFAAQARQFQSPAFRAVVEELSAELLETYATDEAEAAPPS